MSDSIEVEVTIDVEKDAYETFCQEMNSFLVDIYDQWNVFFNTVDNSLLNSAKRCRVRSINAQNSPNKYTITAKTSKSDAIEGAVAVRREIETHISKEQFDSIICQPQNYYKLAPSIIQQELNEFAEIPFKFLIDFRSIRRIFKLGEFLVESDECELPNGVVFYQLEVESNKPDEAKAALEQKLNEIGVKFTPAKYGKFTRLLGIPEGERYSPRLQKQIEDNKNQNL
ncbi:Adenylate cyclase family protein [Tritrichomonas foetus]|uniref:Adenylate cyclase family protein n=1 Tax=Tritrichomonas foetus TaxID=1144522 RepID=A0A1J4JT03_9EUKA|nr:Adenylate cyclase family protein [Tritrichomonas foetus]|eukprot:OHT00636.1 Adenylate cyclase family protein [Tritrichomonas foetus]